MMTLPYVGASMVTTNVAPHLPPLGRPVERKQDIRTAPRTPSGKRGRRLGAGALFGDRALMVCRGASGQSHRLDCASELSTSVVSSQGGRRFRPPSERDRLEAPPCGRAHL